MYRLLAIGLSAGGYPLVKRLLEGLPKNYPLPVVIVAHLPGREESCLAELLDAISPLPVSMASDKEAIRAGRAYTAPPGYHLLVEQASGSTLSFALSVDEPINSVRPSIDVLFESAAETIGAGLIAVLLSGANSDGAEGMVSVKQFGGLCVVLDPQVSEFKTMPEAAIERCDVDYVVGLDEIISLLLSVDEKT